MAVSYRSDDEDEDVQEDVDGEQWREDLPDDWDDTTDHPPRRGKPGVTDLDHGTSTLLREAGSGTAWIQGDDRLVVDVQEEQ